ncbi:MAG: GNAT family N-acetyltransferase [Actinomycetota bacterium]|nr:GNAT family N-acetyltransferase [Actinomycetota bacterium]
MLKGERVILRPIEKEDAARLWELLQTVEVKTRAEDRPPVPRSRSEEEAELERDPGPGAGESAWFAVEAEGEVVGMCGLHHIDHYNGVCDLGVKLGQEYWGRGYGQDAIRTIVEYAFRHMNMRKVGLGVLADDARAVGAYRKVGFVEEGRLRQQNWHDGAYRDTLRMAILRDEWPSAGSQPVR